MAGYSITSSGFSRNDAMIVFGFIDWHLGTSRIWLLRNGTFSLHSGRRTELE